jgi:hypothetical protein
MDTGCGQCHPRAPLTNAATEAPINANGANGNHTYKPAESTADDATHPSNPDNPGTSDTNKTEQHPDTPNTKAENAQPAATDQPPNHGQGQQNHTPDSITAGHRHKGRIKHPGHHPSPRPQNTDPGSRFSVVVRVW